MKKIQKNQEKFRFLIVVTLLILSGFIANSLLSYYVAHNAVSKQISESTLPLTGDNIYSEIQRDLMRPIFIASLMAQDTFLRDWALAGETEADALIRYLDGIQQKYNTVTAFFVSENSRKYYHPKGILKTVDRSTAIDSWYFRVAEMPTEYEINVDHDTANPSKLSVFVNYQVFDYQRNFIGATGVGLALDKVQALIDTYKNKYQREVYFVNHSGDVTLRGAQFQLLDEHPTFALLPDKLKKLKAQQQFKFEYDTQGHLVYVNVRYIPEFDWFLVIEQKDVLEMQKLMDSLLLNILIGIAVSFVVLVLAYWTIAGYQKKLEMMAATDKLSGALNRHSFDIFFERYLVLAERKNLALSGVLLDIDWFKQVNDKHGHLTGDAVIRQAADLVRDNLRESDLLCRWGGEEFLILLPDCNLQAAQKLAEKIRLAFMQAEFIKGERLTASFGVGELNHSENKMQWLNKIDQALYQAKNNGRNLVILS
ncbi:sensor domain-containing diguanylate cyclase [Catenovulum sediminis]|uniref:diguanylate cyclase n=1 Tax=Catenovulum sediminis TaxID=1740262 RepID=A0ABV1RHP3_9ALTE